MTSSNSELGVFVFLYKCERPYITFTTINQLTPEIILCSTTSISLQKKTKRYKGQSVRSILMTFNNCKFSTIHRLEFRSSVNFYLNVYQVTRKSVWGGIHPRWFILSKSESALHYMRHHHTSNIRLTYHSFNNT